MTDSRDEGLLQMLHNGSLNQPTDQAFVTDTQWPVKRQILQPRLPGGINGRPNPTPNPNAGVATPVSAAVPGAAVGAGGQAGTPQQSPSLAPHPNPNLPAPNGSQLALQLKSLLGAPAFAELRTTLMAQQELFNKSLQEMHLIAHRQDQQVSRCTNKAAMQAELDKLHAEQDTQTVSDNTVEQDEAVAGNEVEGGPHNQKESTSSKAETTWAGDTPSGKVPETQQRQMQYPGIPPGMMPPATTDPWSMYRQGYMNAYNQQGWGMPGSMPGGMPGMGGSFPGPFLPPYGHPGMMPPPMDPMLAWYTLHYGQQYHQAMQNQANAAAAKAQQEAQEQDKLNGKKGATKEPIRWWQDPEKVFGLAGDPAVLQNPDFKIAARSRAQEKMRESRSEATSKPPTYKTSQKRGSKQADDVVSEKGDSVDEAAMIEGKPKSVSKDASGQPSTGKHKAGSGVSAFKSLATKAGRRPPTRAESIGSEISRSGADRHPMDDADSSDLNQATLGPNVPD